MLKRFLALLFLWVSVVFAAEPVRYTISLKEPGKHYLHVMVRLRAAASVDLQLPAWNGLYQVRDFAQFVERVSSNTSVRRLDKTTWRVAPAAEDTEVSYEVFADRPGPFGLQLNERHAFLNFAQCLMYRVGDRDAPVELRFADLPPKWRIATALPEDAGLFRARNYDHLADSPAEISAFQETSFQEGPATYRVVVDTEATTLPLSKLQELVRRIVTFETDLMRDVPFARFTFIYHLRPQGGGGMEHAESTAIDAELPDSSHGDRAWDRLAGVTAHEFFHAWNVKRIRPRSLEPVDYTAEQNTRALWFSEGVTSTYGAYAMLRTGQNSRERFLRNLERGIAELERRPAARFQSAEESSQETWFEKYPHYRRPERSISYYQKGELIGFLLDLAIRQATANRRSLDDLMRLMNRRYARQGLFFDEQDDIPKAAEEITGQSFQSFFDTLVRSAVPVDYAQYLNHAGFDLEKKECEVATLGLAASSNFGAPLVVTSIEERGPASKGRIRAGDTLLEINGKRPVGRNLEAATAELKPGETVRLRLERDGQSFEESFPAGRRRDWAYVLSETPHPTALQLKIRRGWLEGKTD